MSCAPAANIPPSLEEFEVTLFGPGYGESIVLHIGNGKWIVIDSCIDDEGTSRALKYLDSISVNPSNSVELIVATHWHDDHIRGMTELIKVCKNASFCCSSALCTKEFLAFIDALEGRHLSVNGSGVREIYSVLNQLSSKASKPTFTLANRRIYNHNKCEIWSLSPNDSAVHNFWKSISAMFLNEGQVKNRIQSISPNDTAVVLWVETGDIRVLLGSDLEKHGWTGILQSSAKPSGKASIFKVPHHGSENAHEPDVWKQMLDTEPFAVLTPWRRGRSILPNQQGVQRILLETQNAYITSKHTSLNRSPVRRSPAISRTIREAGISLREQVMSSGAIRLRRPINSQMPWGVERFGSACNLKELAA